MEIPRESNIFTAVQEHRAQGTAISRKIVQITQKGQELRQEGRYHDASMVEAQVCFLILFDTSRYFALTAVAPRQAPLAFHPNARDAFEEQHSSGPDRKQNLQGQCTPFHLSVSDFYQRGTVLTVWPACHYFLPIVCCQTTTGQLQPQATLCSPINWLLIVLSLEK